MSDAAEPVDEEQRGDPTGTGYLTGLAEEDEQIEADDSLEELMDENDVAGGVRGGAVGGPMGAVAGTEANDPTPTEMEMDYTEPNSPEALREQSGMHTEVE